MHKSTRVLGGRLVVDVVESEVRMSHWIRAPVLIEADSGRILLDLSGSAWDLLSMHDAADSITLQLRQYAESGGAVSLSVSLAPLRFRVAGDPVDAAELRRQLPPSS